MEGGNLNAAPAAGVSGVVFRRRMAALNRTGRRQVFLLFGGVATFLVGTILWLQYQIAHLPPRHGAPVHPHAMSSRSEGDLYFMVLTLLLGVIYVYLIRRYERLYVSPKGIRYVTLFGGSFAFLASLYPSWELGWDELADIRLVKRVGGRATRGAQMWLYELQPRQGAVRRLGAAAWRLDGKPDELDLTMGQNLKRDPAIFKTAFAKTGLFRLLDLTMRARKSQFPQALSE